MIYNRLGTNLQKYIAMTISKSTIVHKYYFDDSRIGPKNRKSFILGPFLAYVNLVENNI